MGRETVAEKRDVASVDGTPRERLTSPARTAEYTVHTAGIHEAAEGVLHPRHAEEDPAGDRADRLQLRWHDHQRGSAGAREFLQLAPKGCVSEVGVKVTSRKIDQVETVNPVTDYAVGNTVASLFTKQEAVETIPQGSRVESIDPKHLALRFDGDEDIVRSSGKPESGNRHDAGPQGSPDRFRRAVPQRDPPVRRAFDHCGWPGLDHLYVGSALLQPVTWLSASRIAHADSACARRGAEKSIVSTLSRKGERSTLL